MLCAIHVDVVWHRHGRGQEICYERVLCFWFYKASAVRATELFNYEAACHTRRRSASELVLAGQNVNGSV